VSSWHTNANSKAIEALKIENERAHAAGQWQREKPKFSEPLARSAYDLQSRIYNILEQGFIDAGAAAGRWGENAAGGRGDLRLVVHIPHQLRDCADFDYRPGVELIAKLRTQHGADPLKEQRMRMELAAIFVLDADRKIAFAPQISCDSQVCHDLINALARTMDSLAERRKSIGFRRNRRNRGLSRCPRFIYL
jgi:hypothetical protein